MTAHLRVSLPDQRLMDAVGPSAGVDFVLWDLAGPAPSEQFDLLVPPYMGKPGALAGNHHSQGELGSGRLVDPCRVGEKATRG